MWPLNHKDKSSLENYGTIRDIQVVEQHPAGLNIKTRQTTAQQILNVGVNTIEKTNKHLYNLVKEVHRGLNEEVYDSSTLNVIEKKITLYSHKNNDKTSIFKVFYKMLN